MSSKEDKEEQEGNVSSMDDDGLIPQGPTHAQVEIE